MKYAKTVMQLEKGLPPNSVVPILKEKVEGMRHKVKNITNATQDLKVPERLYSKLP